MNKTATTAQVRELLAKDGNSLDTSMILEDGEHVISRGEDGNAMIFMEYHGYAKPARTSLYISQEDWDQLD